MIRAAQALRRTFNRTLRIAESLRFDSPKLNIFSEVDVEKEAKGGHSGLFQHKKTVANTQATDVSCAVIVRQGMILAANRNESVSNSGAWEFPGGKPKPDETPEECVIRRVHEELSLSIHVVDKIEPYTVETASGKVFNIHPFVAEIVNGQVELNLHSRAEWFMPMQLMSLAWPETDLPIIDEIVGRIFKNGKIA